MIVIARNPYDVIKESADAKNLFDCNDRLQIDQNYLEDHFDWWDKWVNAQTENLANSHAYVIDKVTKKIPSLFIRFEDLVRNPEQALTDVFKFVLDRDSISGTVLERRIRELADGMKDPDSAECSSFSNLFLMQQKQHIESSLTNYNSFFGYNSYLDFDGGYSTITSTQANQQREESLVNLAMKDQKQFDSRGYSSFQKHN